MKRLTVLCLCLGFLGGVIVFPSAVFGYVEADTYGVRVDENVPINLLPQQMRDYYPANTGWNVTLGYICASSCEESEIIYDWDCYGEPYNYARWKFPVPDPVPLTSKHQSHTVTHHMMKSLVQT